MRPMGFRLSVYCVILAGAVTIGTAGFMLVEHLPFIDALYFTIVTVATVGYGDIHPVTEGGRILAIGVIIAGVGSFVGVAATLIEIMIDSRDRRVRMTKLNMIIGSFFSECGTPLLRRLTRADPGIAAIRSRMVLTAGSGAEDFAALMETLSVYPYGIDISLVDLEELRGYLHEQRMFLLRLLDNPMLFEHDEFAELLLALIHITDELHHRDGFGNLPGTDLLHLRNDLVRIYSHLVRVWVGYMRHLKDRYPYLYSLAMRTNPFDPDASVIVRS